MKNFSIILLIALMGTAELVAQRIGDPPPLSRFNGSNYTYKRNKDTLIADNSERKGYRVEGAFESAWNTYVNINFNDTTLIQPNPNNFLFGYHWSFGNNKLIERRIGMNMPMSHFGWNRTLREGSTLNSQILDTTGSYIMSDHFGIIDGHPYNRTIYPIIQYTAFLNDENAGLITMNSLIEWRPSAPPFYQDSAWKPIKGDRFGSINGFYNKSGGTTITDSNQAGFMGFALHPSLLPNGGTLLALSKPAMHTEMRRTTNELIYTRFYTRSLY